MDQGIFEKLKELQDVLSEKFKIEHEIENIPKLMVTKKELLTRLKKTYIEKNDRIENTKKKISNLRIKLAETETLRGGFEKQMDEIETQREYEILDKEIKDASDREQSYRKDIIKFEKDLEEQQIALERDENLIKQQEEELKAEVEKNKKENDLKQEQLTKLKQHEKEIIPGMDEDILFKFNRIVKSKLGVGIVPIKDSVCSGCHMILPAQFANEVRKGGEILFCPYCSRILFFEDANAEEVYDTEFLSDEDSGALSDLDDDDDF